MQLTLSKIYRSKVDKEGKTLTTKQGKPYERVSIKVSEPQYAGKYISGFGNKDNEGWKEGDVVELIITEVGQYLNFTMPNKTDMIAEQMRRLEDRIERLEDIERKRQDKETEEQIGDDINPEDIPF